MATTTTKKPAQRPANPGALTAKTPQTHPAPIAGPAPASLPPSDLGLDEAMIRQWIESGEKRAVLDVLVTPAIARVMLEYNHPGESNRRLSKVYTSSAARAMIAGAWENTGEPVIFSDAKLLNDGQHRLTAIVESNVPAVMDLRFGVGRQAFGSTNSGRKRGAGDALYLLGAGNHYALAAAARMLLWYEGGLPDSMYIRHSNSEVVDFVERHPDLQHAVALTAGMRINLRAAITNALSYIALQTGDKATYKGFFEVVKVGGGDPNSPPHLLREYLIKNSTGRNDPNRVRGFAVAILAWNAWLSGKTRMERLTWRADMPFPIVPGLKL
jgi:hypothetical protein